jgi:hypothetical protein
MADVKNQMSSIKCHGRYNTVQPCTDILGHKMYKLYLSVLEIQRHEKYCDG